MYFGLCKVHNAILAIMLHSVKEMMDTTQLHNLHSARQCVAPKVSRYEKGTQRLT
jgi:hypothetical protein